MAASRVAFWLAVFTVVYNLGEGAISLLFSSRDGSVALLGFGIDSFVESLSGAVMLWRFWDEAEAERRERGAARLVGVSLLVLATYVVYESASTLIDQEETRPSLAALIIGGVSLVVMPVLFLLKRRTARLLGSASLRADSQQTLACVMLSVALLVGAGANYSFGWWYADAAAGIVIGLYLLREGYHALTTCEVCRC